VGKWHLNNNLTLINVIEGRGDKNTGSCECQCCENKFKINVIATKLSSMMDRLNHFININQNGTLCHNNEPAKNNEMPETLVNLSKSLAIYLSCISLLIDCYGLLH